MKLDNTLREPEQSPSVLTHLLGLDMLKKKLASKDEVLAEINATSTVFFVLITLEVIAGLLLFSGELIADGIAFAVLTLLFRRFRSRLAAIVLFLASMGAMVLTILNAAAAEIEPSMEVMSIVLLLRLVFAITGVRSIRAAVAFQRMKKSGC